MSKRNYNVFFNTHTVSGIVISIALYVIFFAGSFAFFKEEIQVWQEGKPSTHTSRANINYDNILSEFDEEYDLHGRDFNLNLRGKEDNIFVYLLPSKDTLASEKAKISQYLYTDIHTVETQNYNEQYSLGEFLYRLHFFAQIPLVGMYLAGFVAVFFLFAIVTGIIVHWKKIISNFYHFKPNISLKRVWADAHTALGVIGLPFQFMFAVTGAFFGLSILVLLPANFLYNGNQEKLMEDLRPERKTYDWVEESDSTFKSMNDCAKIVSQKWKHFHLTSARVSNYGGVNMKYIFSGELDTKSKFIGAGDVIFNAYTGAIEHEASPYETGYVRSIQMLLGRLHFARFGGLFIKIMYFLLAIATCFVIITGVLIWIESRNSKTMLIRQRLFTADVGHIYLAMCLSMLPVTALAFLFVKYTEGMFEVKQSAIYHFYFWTWLAFTLFFRYRRDNYITNKYTLLLGAIFGFLVPISNGIMTGNWIWNAYANHQHEILLIDILWLLIAGASLFIFYKIKPSAKNKSAFTKHPIDYKNLKALRAEERAKLAVQSQSNITINELENQNEIPMRTKITILWIFLGIGWIVHHIYGLFGVYYNESLMMEGATGDVPMVHHIYRIVFEGLCLLFGLLSIEVSKRWFRNLSFIWAILAGLYNVYHLFEALMHEASNISEIFMLIIIVVASIFLVNNIFKWRRLA